MTILKNQFNTADIAWIEMFKWLDYMMLQIPIVCKIVDFDVAWNLAC